MHALDLAHLAGTLVRCSETLVSLEKPVDSQALESYWLAGRFRYEHWSERLASHRRAIQGPGISYRNSRWHEIVPVIQEVLISEPLTRCMAYLAQVLAERGIDQEFAALTQNALAVHVEARHRCLHLIVFGQGLSVETAVKLNRLRRAMENYNDQLFAAMPPVGDLEELCFEPLVVQQSQREWGGYSRHTAQAELYVHLLAPGLRRALGTDMDHRAANARLNFQLSQAVLGCLPSSLFDRFGVPKSRLLLALQKCSLESTGKCNDLLSPLASPLNMLLASSRQLSTPPKSKPRW